MKCARSVKRWLALAATKEIDDSRLKRYLNTGHGDWRDDRGYDISILGAEDVMINFVLILGCITCFNLISIVAALSNSILVAKI